MWRRIEGLAEKETLLAFVREATAQDAGEAAFVKYFGHSLGDVVAEMFGEGEWQPKVYDQAWLELQISNNFVDFGMDRLIQ